MVTEVVVVGNGMVGSRFAEDLHSRDHERRFAVTVLGAEAYEPYNRVLLSELVAGKVSAATLTLPTQELRAQDPQSRPVVTHRGCEVVAIDRGNRVVTTADGRAKRYDHLVLATGARARIPNIAGLQGSADSDPQADPQALPHGVHALRTLDDAREIVAATLNARTAVVIGGGVLGLEVATGLANRGLAVQVVHAAPGLMERQLDAEASSVVVAALDRAGVASVLSAQTEQVVTHDGRVVGVHLADGRFLAAELLVLACGTIPETGLARAAGLDVDRGVVVGTDLGTPSDPRIHAIGDCAQPPGGSAGLIAQGWEQSRRLAGRLVAEPAGSAPQPATGAESRTDVVRVKATGLDLVTMGSSSAAPVPPGSRVLRLSDPASLRLIEIVVADGLLVGATCLGAGQVAADLTVAYTRGTPLPSDPASLLIRPVHGAPEQTASPTNMPDRHTVCRCNGVTKRDIITSWARGARTVTEVAHRTRATTGCGGCKEAVSGIVDWLATSDPDQGPDDSLAPARRASGAPAPAGGPDSSPGRRPEREQEVPAAKHRSHGLETQAG
jgi:assimilatory nitrate reductase electron transfer subunit